MQKYKTGDIIYVRLEKWALKECENPPVDGIAKAIFMYDDGDSCGSMCFKIDTRYQCHFPQIFHNYANIVACNNYAVELI